MLSALLLFKKKVKKNNVKDCTLSPKKKLVTNVSKK